MPSWRNGRRAGLKHLWETVPVRVRRWVLNRKTPDKALFIRGFWFDKRSAKHKTVYFQTVTCSSLQAFLFLILKAFHTINKKAISIIGWV